MVNDVESIEEKESRLLSCLSSFLIFEIEALLKERKFE